MAFRFQPPVIGHRGACAEAPENTLTSLMLARKQGATWIEFDVMLTQDGVPILMHDETLDRTTNGKGNVADASWAYIQTLDAGSWFGSKFTGERVPHLNDALRFVITNGLQLNLEIKPAKGHDKATAMVALIEAAKIWPLDLAPPLITSFSREALATAKQLQPRWPRGLAFDDWNSDWRATAAQLELQTFTVDEEIITQEKAATLKQTGLATVAYTVNDPARAKQLLSLGIDAVFSDNPKLLIAAL